MPGRPRAHVVPDDAVNLYTARTRESGQRNADGEEKLRVEDERGEVAPNVLQYLESSGDAGNQSRKVPAAEEMTELNIFS